MASWTSLTAVATSPHGVVSAGREDERIKAVVTVTPLRDAEHENVIGCLDGPVHGADHHRCRAVQRRNATPPLIAHVAESGIIGHGREMLREVMLRSGEHVHAEHTGREDGRQGTAAPGQRDEQERWTQGDRDE